MQCRHICSLGNEKNEGDILGFETGVYSRVGVFRITGNIEQWINRELYSVVRVLFARVAAAVTGPRRCGKSGNRHVQYRLSLQ